VATSASARVLILAISARAISESATRAGFAAHAVDAFGDLDQIGHTPTVALAREHRVPWSARAAAVAARGIPCDMVVYGSGFENYPAVVSALATLAPVVGNTPDVLRRVRDPIHLAATLGARGFSVPAVSTAAPPMSSRGSRDLTRRRWLRKPRDSGGGHGIANWRSGVPLAQRMVLQERIAGTPGSIVFAANGSRAVALALSTQLIGDPRFGAGGFRYCGNILDHASDDALLDAALALAEGATEEFGLVGVNGIDFVARDGTPWIIEINPRYSASMELAERVYGVPVFDVHVRACRGELPSFDLRQARRHPEVEGKAVLYARRTVRLGDTTPWLADGGMRDVPHPGETIPKGRPICTIFARAADAAACQTALVRRAQDLYALMERDMERRP
jgi:predicted ATP-grasp superfamily ATP-dependent carboligase